LQLHPVVATYALLEISEAVISAVVLLEEYVRQTLPVSRNFVTSWCIVVLFSTFLPGFTLLNASQMAANSFSVK
jgi:hypothetical protein